MSETGFEHFEKRRRKNTRSEVSNDDVLNQFSDLACNEPKFNTRQSKCCYQTMKPMQNNKVYVYDNVGKEYFTICKDVLMSCLYLLFNNVSKLGHFHYA